MITSNMHIYMATRFLSAVVDKIKPHLYLCWRIEIWTAFVCVLNLINYCSIFSFAILYLEVKPHYLMPSSKSWQKKKGNISSKLNCPWNKLSSEWNKSRKIRNNKMLLLSLFLYFLFWYSITCPLTIKDANYIVLSQNPTTVYKDFKYAYTNQQKKVSPVSFCCCYVSFI